MDLNLYKIEIPSNSGDYIRYDLRGFHNVKVDWDISNYKARSKMYPWDFCGVLAVL